MIKPHLAKSADRMFLVVGTAGLALILCIFLKFFINKVGLDNERMWFWRMAPSMYQTDALSITEVTELI